MMFVGFLIFIQLSTLSLCYVSPDCEDMRSKTDSMTNFYKSVIDLVVEYAKHDKDHYKNHSHSRFHSEFRFIETTIVQPHAYNISDCWTLRAYSKAVEVMREMSSIENYYGFPTDMAMHKIYDLFNEICPEQQSNTNYSLMSVDYPTDCKGGAECKRTCSGLYISRNVDYSTLCCSYKQSVDDSGRYILYPREKEFHYREEMGINNNGKLLRNAEGGELKWDSWKLYEAEKFRFVHPCGCDTDINCRHRWTPPWERQNRIRVCDPITIQSVKDKNQFVSTAYAGPETRIWIFLNSNGEIPAPLVYP